MLVQHGCCAFGLPEPQGWRDQLRPGWRLSSQHAARVLDFLFHLQVGQRPRNIGAGISGTNERRRLLSDSGRSFAFDDRGTGFGRGEGCGMLVLKPLEQAIRDNDTIRAVIAGTGLNQDGKTPGITMPNGAAQGKPSRPRRFEGGRYLTVSRGAHEAGLPECRTRP